MTYGIAIDPGVRMSGVSVFAGGQFARADLIRCGKKDVEIADCIKTQVSLLNMYSGMLEFASYAVIECPVVYDRQHQKKRVDPNDLIKLSLVVGSLITLFLFYGVDHIWTPKPRVWKGGTPKSIHNQRVLAKYPELETWLEQIPVSYRHNVIDAVGLNDWGEDQEKCHLI